MPQDNLPAEFWTAEAEDALRALGSNPDGLTPEDATRRRDVFGPNALKRKRSTASLTILWGQFKSPIILILLFAAARSYFLHDRVDALIIFVIIGASGLLGFWQERGSTRAMEKLLAIVQVRTTVRRGGGTVEIPVEEIVPGDIVLLKAGDIIPADCLVLDSKDLYANEASP